MNKLIKDLTSNNRVVVFAKSWCKFSKRVKFLFDNHNVNYLAFDMDLEFQNDENRIAALQDELKVMTGLKTVPNVWINNKFAGDSSQMQKIFEEKKLFKLIENHDFDYDFLVIGGGSGGLSCSKAAHNLGRKVGMLDYIKPSPIGTTWGMGGTCVNVGCVPKKLMHQAAIQGHNAHDGKAFGWKHHEEKSEHDWHTLVKNVTNHIKGINQDYEDSYRDQGIDYINAFGSFIDKNTVKCVNYDKNEEKIITADKILIAIGERPVYPPEIDPKYVITSDDLFRLPYNPGKVLIIGASYIALECAGFLKGLGNEVDVMVRSIFLRGFDQEMAEKIGKALELEGVKFIRPDTVKSIEQLIEPSLENKEPGLYQVTSEKGHSDQYQTILYAIGRKADLKTLNLDEIGVQYEKNKVIVDDFEQTNINNIYAIGDVAKNRPQLTPAAIHGGRTLANRLFGHKSLTGDNAVPTDYVNIPTTVFTPLEYSSVGYSEEQAIEKFSAENVSTYYKTFKPLEYSLPRRFYGHCYMKVLVEKISDKVIGMHYLGPNAGEVMQGFAAAVKCGMTKKQLDNTVGIHPTTAEAFCSMTVTKEQGGKAQGG